MMGGADANPTETDLLELWLENGGRLFDKIPYQIDTSYSKGKTGVRKVKSAVTDEFAESTAFYQGLSAQERALFFGTGEKLGYGSIGNSLAEKLQDNYITRFTNPDGTVDYDAVISEFRRQWDNMQRGNDFIRERDENLRDEYAITEMTDAEAADRLDAELASADQGGINPYTGTGRVFDDSGNEIEFSRPGQVMFSRRIIDNKETAVAEGYPLSIRDARDPDKVLEVLSPIVGKSAAQIGEMKLTRISAKSVEHLINSEHAQYDKKANGREKKKLWRGTVAGMSVMDDIIGTSSLGKKENAKHFNKEWKKGAVFYRAKTRFAVETEDGKYMVYPCELIVSETNGNREVYDLTEVGNPTPTTSVEKPLTVGGPQLRGLTANGGVGFQTPHIISNSADSRQGGQIEFSRPGIFTGSAADYANRSRRGGEEDGPSLHHVGTGEGSQVYGWGLYGSTRRGIAEGYAKSDYNARHATLTVDGERVDFGREEKWSKAKRAALYELNATRNVEEAIQNLKYSREHATQQTLAEHAIKYLRKHEFGGLVSEYIYEQTFFTDRAPGDESHLLKWYEPVSKENVKRVLAQYAKEYKGADLRADTPSGTLTLEDFGDKRAFESELKENAKAMSEDGASLYSYLTGVLGGEKAASEFLARAGIDGVKYPADSYGKTVKDGDQTGWNYVSFRDDNIRVDHKWTDGQMMFARPLRISKEEYARVSALVSENEAHAIKHGGEHPPHGVARTSNKIYIYDYFSDKTFSVTDRLPISKKNAKIFTDQRKAFENAIVKTAAQFAGSVQGDGLRPRYDGDALVTDRHPEKGRTTRKLDILAHKNLQQISNSGNDFQGRPSDSQRSQGRKDGIWRNRLPFAIPKFAESSDKIIGGVVYDADVIIKDEGNGKYLYDVSNLKKDETLTRTLARQGYPMPSGGKQAANKAVSARASQTPHIVSNSADSRQGGQIDSR